MFQVNPLQLRKTRPQVTMKIRIQGFIEGMIGTKICNIERLGDTHQIWQTHYIGIVINLVQDRLSAVFFGLQLTVSAYWEHLFAQKHEHILAYCKQLPFAMSISSLFILGS